MKKIHIVPLMYAISKNNGGDMPFDRMVELLSVHFTPNDNNLIIDTVGEGEYGINLALAIINRFNITNVKLILDIAVPENVISAGVEYETTRIGMCDYFNFYTVLQSDSVDWQNINLTHHIVSLARNASLTRAMYIKNILDFFGDKSLVSFGLIGNVNNQMKNILKPYDTPILLDNYDLNKHASEAVFTINNPPDHKVFGALVNVVLETAEQNGRPIRITEKTFKAFAWHQLPIIVANYGHVKIVRELGFDMFDDIFDNHSYADLQPDMCRMKIMSLLKGFTQKYPTLVDIQQLRTALWPRLDYNNKLLAKYVKEGNYTW